MRVDVGKLSAGLNDFHLRRLQTFFLSLGGALGALGVVRGNDFAFQQILLPFCVCPQKFQLRRLRIGVVNGGVDLCGRQLAPGPEFGRCQLHDQLAFM